MYGSSYTALLQRYGTVTKVAPPQPLVQQPIQPTTSPMRTSGPGPQDERLGGSGGTQVPQEIEEKPRAKISRKDKERIEENVKFQFASKNGQKSGEVRRANAKTKLENAENGVLDGLGEMSVKEARKTIRKDKKTINILRKAMLKVEKDLGGLPEDSD